MKTVSRDALQEMIGGEVGVSDWFTIDQQTINRFADVTHDHQFIHVDEEAAAKTPFGGTVAHGFLTLSMLSHLAATAGMPVLEDLVMGINYGFDKVRFVQPVRAGKRVRGRFVLGAVEEGSHGRFTLKFAVTVEIEGEEKPALAAEWLTMQVVQQQ
ncbi:MaoC family dehydratase [Parvularcula flava]|uniref:MaoC family dehydratase n=1 Tax=Aquisalinus luteolus TaxID=1566827 RepID=A0A8J3A0J8_9PROT|nr:MaoC family dehydratase [Aquisalinus luteolus]NHK26806.1 MaoC family dehydratase [Aquisalinus luteolus]GGH93469.1 nodulation protein NodN [Aquisalinus luteolus]